MHNFLARFKTVITRALITAGFIGPGIITACAVSGATFGYTLLWTVLFACVATMILQEMAVRLGASTKSGFAENLKVQIKPKVLKFVAVFILAVCIFFGNLAFQIGNFAGTSMAVSSVFPKVNPLFWIALICIVIIVFIFTDSYKQIRSLISVALLLMGLGFFLTAIIVKPDLSGIIQGLFVPSMKNTDETWICVVSIIGTTIVPYNLFLCATTSAKYHTTKQSIHTARLDTLASVALGGIIAIAITICAVSAFHANQAAIEGTNDLAVTLSPMLNEFSNFIFAIGFFCASFSAAIVVPISAADAIAETFVQTSDNTKKQLLKIISLIIVALSGFFYFFLNNTPITIILFAQIVNAIILPVIVACLIFVSNSKRLGNYRNTAFSNILSIIVFIITVLISYRGILLIIHKLEALSILP